MNRTHEYFAIAVFVTIAVFMGCTKMAGTNRTVEKNKALLQRYIDEMNRGNEDFLDEYFAEDYAYHGPAGELDLEGFKAVHHMFLSAFTDINTSIEDIIAIGDKVATRYTINGTHQNEFQGIAATGRKITITGIIMTQVKDGKVIEEWEAFDRLSLMQQLGVIPVPENPSQ
jgi:steroid delta-isomerase-like uncharacterized protein